MTKEKQEVKDTKTLGTYKVNFKTDFDLKTDDFIYLNIEISEDLKDLIKSVCLIETDLVKFERYGLVCERYKVKSWLYNSLYNDERDYLFETNLVNDGKISLKFTNTDYITNMVRNFKDLVRSLIDNVLKYKDYEVNVKYSVSEKDE